MIESPGASLDPRTRGLFEGRFAQDLSSVRVHADGRAAASARAVGASAYTVGRHIAFASDAFAPDTEAGRRLLAHELTHVLQQPSTEAPERGALRIGEPTSRLEREADEVGASISPRPVSRAAQVAIQRQTTHPPTTTTPTRPTATPSTDWRVGAEAFNLILQNEFPLVNSDWYLGTRSNLPPGGAVSADTAGGRDGRVMFALSPDFAPAGQTATATATDPGRIAAVRTEVIRVLEWRLSLGLLTGNDIAAPFVSAYLRTMPPLALRALRARPTGVDAAAQAELDRILAITTQIPAAARFTSTGAAEMTLNGLTVRILPDTSAGTGNATHFRMVPAAQATPGFRSMGGHVTAIVGTMPTPPVIEIFTSYAARGPQAGLDPVTGRSGYGRGTTAADVAGGTTSLRFHESRHGADFLSFIGTHPYPTYGGQVGMTERAFRAAGSSFLAAVQAWSRDMGDASLCATDCVGTPNIDVFEGNSGAGLKCTTCHP